MKHFFIFMALAIILACGGSLWLRAEYHHFLETPLALPAAGYVLQVQPGTPGRALVETLEEEGFTQASWEWKLLMRLEPMMIHAGEFALGRGLRPQGLLELLSSGAVIQYRLTLVEGWTFQQFLEALGKDEILEQTPGTGESGLYGTIPRQPGNCRPGGLVFAGDLSIHQGRL